MKTGRVLKGGAPVSGGSGGGGTTPTVTVNSGDDLATKINFAAEGARIQINAGTYRVTTAITPKTGQRIYGSGAVVIDGSANKTSWTSDGFGRWYSSHTFQTRDSIMRDGSYSVCELTSLAGTGASGGSGASAHNSCWDRDQAWWDGARMKNMVSLGAGDLGSGNRFYIDRSNNRLYVWNNPAGHTVEVSATPHFVNGGGTANDVHINGVTIQKFASPAQKGAITLTNVSGWEIGGNVIQFNHAHGIFNANGSNIWVHHNMIYQNGQLGMGVGTTSGPTTYSGSLIEYNTFQENNQEDFYIGDWEAGGFKASSKSGGLVRYNTFKDNKGLDMWVDFGSNWVFDNNTSDGAFGQAIRLEVATNCIVKNNRITRSGVDIGAHYKASHTNWATVMDTAAISISECQVVEVFGNTITDPNLNGIIVNIRGRKETDRVAVHSNYVEQKQAAIPTGAAGTSTVGTMIAAGINMSGAPSAASVYFDTALTWTMPNVGVTAGSGKTHTKKVVVSANTYDVGADKTTAKRFVWKNSGGTGTTYYSHDAYVALNTTDGKDATLPAGWTTVLFEDYFTGSAVDTTKWRVREDTQTNHDGRNFKRNCTVANGYLSIRSGTDNTVDPASKPWTSGYMDTQTGLFNFRWGRAEIRARFPWGPTAYGYWPAFWLRPEDGTIGEIDVFEGWPKRNDVKSALWYDYVPTFPHIDGPQQMNVPGFDPTQWHVYAVEKEVGVMRFYVDDRLVWTVGAAPINNPSWFATTFDRAVNWHLRVQLQIGGSWGGQPTATTVLSQTYDVDYVRVLAR